MNSTTVSCQSDPSGRHMLRIFLRGPLKAKTAEWKARTARGRNIKCLCSISMSGPFSITITTMRASAEENESDSLAKHLIGLVVFQIEDVQIPPSPSHLNTLLKPSFSAMYAFKDDVFGKPRLTRPSFPASCVQCLRFRQNMRSASTLNCNALFCTLSTKFLTTTVFTWRLKTQNGEK